MKLIVLIILFGSFLSAQDSLNLNSSNIFNRPLSKMLGSPISIGGYLEANTNYFSEDGISEGFNMEMRRMNLFIGSDISKRIQFISELEFEHGTEEIALETALIDFNLHPLLHFRGGIVLPTIGWFNANHDSPLWEFIERPLVATQLVPSTLSEVGFGLTGKYYFSETSGVNYDFYIVNGLQDGVVFNETGRTFIPGGKTPKAFEEDNNGTPMYNIRVGISNPFIDRLGISYYGGVYNSYKVEGDVVDDKRSLHIYSIDASKDFGDLKIQGNYTMAKIDIPASLSPLYGTTQSGSYIDFIYPIHTKSVLGFDQSKINLSIRLENMEYNNDGILNSEVKTDYTKGFRIGTNWRPQSKTIIKANYGFYESYDYLGNPPAFIGSFQFGFASYF